MRISLHTPPPLMELLSEADLKLVFQPLSRRLEAVLILAAPGSVSNPVVYDSGKRVTARRQLETIQSAIEAIGFTGDRRIYRFSADRQSYTFRPVRCAGEIMGLFGYRPLKKPRNGASADDMLVLGLIEGMLDSRFRVFLTSQMHIETTEENYRQLEKNYAQLVEAQRRLEHLDQLKSDFVANVNHELRTPLTAVLGFTELLLAEKEKFDPDHLECINQIHDKSSHLIRLINRVLAFSEIESRRQNLLKTVFDMPALVAETVQNLAPYSAEKNVRVAVEAPEATLPVDADRDKVGLVIDDLIQNAIKFSPSGRTVRVRVYSEGEPDTSGNQFLALAGQGVASTYVEVRDEGPGMSFDQVPEIFVDFHQIDSGSTREHGGLGLGLPLAKRLVELNSGSITVQTEAGKGSVFLVRIPASTRSIRTERTIGQVLAIEDDDATARVMQQFVESGGGVFRHAANGRSGIAEAQASPPDIVLLDLKLPDIGGIEVARELGKDGRTRTVPVVAVTAVSDTAEHTRALEAGCRAVLVKPFTRERLLDVIRQFRHQSVPAPVRIGRERTTAGS